MVEDLVLTSENSDEIKAVPKKKRMPLHDKVVFKDYSQNCLPFQLDLNTMIPENHVVRIVNRAIDKIDLKPLIAKYSGGGTSSYHPVMMLKLLIYAYVDKIYSSRRIEKATRENINYMWLCGFLTPDFKTINNFRGQRMKDVLEKVFYEIVDVLIQEGYVKLENYFLDGTKIEANASKYSWVWGKSTKRYKEQLRDKCKELFVKIDNINSDEEAKYGSDNLEEYGSGKQIKRPDAHRRIYINRRWNELKAQTNTNLTGDDGKKMQILTKPHRWVDSIQVICQKYEKSRVESFTFLHGPFLVAIL